MLFGSSSEVTITIDNNIWYVSKYHPKKISYIERGKNDIEPIFPWEINLPIGQFKTFASALGMEVYHDDDIQYGKIDPEELMYLLDIFIPKLSCKPETVRVCANGEEIVEPEMDRDYIDSVVSELYEIAKEANRRKAMVLWS